MATIRKVAIFGASGNFGTPITAALLSAGFAVTIITRVESKSTFPPGIPVVRAEYTTEKLTVALAEQDAAVCVVGPAGIHLQSIMIDAAEAAGVSRFIIDDFGWGPVHRGLPELRSIQLQRRAQWDHGKGRAEANPAFTWTGITTGNPIDWAMKRFPLMGFNITNNSATIYDSGTEKFTGTTLEGIGQAVVGVLQHPDETANRFVRVMSIHTCQNELLEAFQNLTGKQWDVEHSTVKALKESGQAKLKAGTGGWVLPLVVAQLYDEGEACCKVAPSRGESESDLVGVRAETAQDVVAKVLAAR
ncbi:hypothetical protein DL771_004796 [Monosporascus sp. 5C6A]|nr:hypothetical protein DL771_004796 [Monosporascus sp. 5C6A]